MSGQMKEVEILENSEMNIKSLAEKGKIWTMEREMNDEDNYRSWKVRKGELL